MKAGREKQRRVEKKHFDGVQRVYKKRWGRGSSDWKRGEGGWVGNTHSKEGKQNKLVMVNRRSPKNKHPRNKAGILSGAAERHPRSTRTKQTDAIFAARIQFKTLTTKKKKNNGRRKKEREKRRNEKRKGEGGKKGGRRQMER